MLFRALSLLAVLITSTFGLDGTKLAAIQPAMEQAVAAKQAAGVMTLVMEKGKVVHHEAAGMADIAAG